MNQYAPMLYRSFRYRLAACAAVCIAVTGTRQAVEANEFDLDAAKLLPDTVVGLVHVPNLGKSVATIIDHPHRQRLMSVPAYQAVLKSDEFAKFKIGLTAFEGTMQQPWRAALQTLSNGGVTIGLDSSDGGVALLMRCSDREALKRFREFLVTLRQLGGQKSKPGEYRGFAAYAFGDDLKLAWIDDWFLATNKAELGKAIIDRYLDHGVESFHSNERFRNAAERLQPNNATTPAIVGYLDLETLRNAGVAKDVFNERVDNFFGELVLGGILANLRHTPYATIQLDVETEGLQLQIATPHERAWESPREYYFGESEHATAPPLLHVKDRLFALSSHRDLSQMWLRSGDLLSDRATDELAKADTQLTTFFSGRDFGEDILGSFKSGLQLVGKSHDFSGQLPQPAIKLPAFALQFRMKDPKSTQSELRRIFQSFIGFVNITGAMNGQPQFDLGTESVGDAQLFTATYVPGIDERESVTAPINFNFSPTIAFAGERFILSSSIPLARELVATGKQADRPIDDEVAANTVATLDAHTLQDILEANQPQLVANNMLEEGNSKEAAEAEIGLLLELVGLFQSTQLSLDVTESQMRLNLELNLDSNETAATSFGLAR